MSHRTKSCPRHPHKETTERCLFCQHHHCTRERRCIFIGQRGRGRCICTNFRPQVPKESAA